MVRKRAPKNYDIIISALFESVFREGGREFDFTQDQIVHIAGELGISLKNPPDVVYTYRSRSHLPSSIRKRGNWLIKSKGKGKFAFVKTDKSPFIEIQSGLLPITIPNAMPEIVEKHTTSDEQALISAIRYNRLVDIFTDVTCFHIQSHVRTTIEGEGQVEIDELYVGIDTDGNEYVLPLEAKSAHERERLGWMQIANMVKYAHQNYPSLKCKPIAAKRGANNQVYLLEFSDNPDWESIAIVQMKLYEFVREVGVEHDTKSD